SSNANQIGIEMVRPDFLPVTAMLISLCRERRSFRVSFRFGLLLMRMSLFLDSRLLLERSHIDGKAVLHIGLEHSLVGFVNLLDWDHFDIGGDVVLSAEVEHLLSLGD